MVDIMDVYKSLNIRAGTVIKNSRNNEICS